MKGTGQGPGLLWCEAGSMGMVPEAAGWREERMVLVVCRPAAGQLRGRRRRKVGGPSWDLESRPAPGNKGDDGGTCEKTRAWEVTCPSRFSSEMVSRACTQLAYKMRFCGGEEYQGWGEGLRPRKAQGCKNINSMNSILISLAHKSLHTLWLPVNCLELVRVAPGWNCAHWPLWGHLPASEACPSVSAKYQDQWYPLWLCCQSQFHGPGWGQGSSVSCEEKDHPPPWWPVGPQSAPSHLSPLWFSQTGGGYRSHNGFSVERAKKGQNKVKRQISKWEKIFVPYMTKD